MAPHTSAKWMRGSSGCTTCTAQPACAAGRRTLWPGGLVACVRARSCAACQPLRHAGRRRHAGRSHMEGASQGDHVILSAFGHACVRRRPAAAAGLGHRPAGRDHATRGGRAPGRACASRGSPSLNVRPASCGRPSSTKGDAGLAALPRRTPCSMSFAGARAPGSVTDQLTRRAREDGRRRPGLACRRYRVV